MPQDGKQQLSTKPPCTCDDCLRETALRIASENELRFVEAEVRSIEKRDDYTTSRKGRRPLLGTAMTPADRKRRQRQKAKEAKASDPSWLRLRKELFEYLFNRYLLNNVDELASALDAISHALVIANCVSKISPVMARDALIAISNPESWVWGASLPELLQYTPDITVVSEGFQDRKLVELYCDIFDSHESNEVRR